MNIDSLVKQCLEKGQMHISAYHDGYLCATLDMYDKELFRVFSEKGVNHLLLLLAAQVLENNSTQERADSAYSYSLAPTSPERHVPLYRLVSKGSVSIFLTGDIVHIEQYVSTMQSLSAKPRPSSRTGFGPTLSEAIGALEKKEFTMVTCVSDKPE